MKLPRPLMIGLFIIIASQWCISVTIAQVAIPKNDELVDSEEIVIREEEEKKFCNGIEGSADKLFERANDLSAVDYDLAEKICELAIKFEAMEAECNSESSALPFPCAVFYLADMGRSVRSGLEEHSPYAERPPYLESKSCKTFFNVETDLKIYTNLARNFLRQTRSEDQWCSEVKELFKSTCNSANEVIEEYNQAACDETLSSLFCQTAIILCSD